MHYYKDIEAALAQGQVLNDRYGTMYPVGSDGIGQPLPTDSTYGVRVMSCEHKGKLAWAFTSGGIVVLDFEKGNRCWIHADFEQYFGQAILNFYCPKLLIQNNQLLITYNEFSEGVLIVIDRTTGEHVKYTYPFEISCAWFDGNLYLAGMKPRYRKDIEEKNHYIFRAGKSAIAEVDEGFKQKYRLGFSNLWLNHLIKPYKPKDYYFAYKIESWFETYQLSDSQLMIGGVFDDGFDDVWLDTTVNQANYIGAVLFLIKDKNIKLLNVFQESRFRCSLETDEYVYGYCYPNRKKLDREPNIDPADRFTLFTVSKATGELVCDQAVIVTGDHKDKEESAVVPDFSVRYDDQLGYYGSMIKLGKSDSDHYYDHYTLRSQDGINWQATYVKGTGVDDVVDALKHRDESGPWDVIERPEQEPV